MADPAMAAASAVAERTNEPLHGLDPERQPAALRHLIRNGSGSVGYRLGGKRRSARTIERQAKTIEALAFEAWSGTQRCVFCPRGYCERCRSVLDQLEALGFGERMREWAG